ncbi:MAG: 3-hydroxyacyl-CoA dehydrogenase family protein [Bdellovibrionota bacterium]
MNSQTLLGLMFAVLAIMEVLHKGLGEDKYRPAPLLRRYVEAGCLGRKSKRFLHLNSGEIMSGSFDGDSR